MDRMTDDGSGEGGRQSLESCPKNYMPWIWTLVVMAVLTIAWASYESYKKEGKFFKQFFSGDRGDSSRHSDGAALHQTGKIQEPVEKLQQSYHTIIEEVRPAVISIDAAVQDGQQAAAPMGDAMAGMPVVNFTRIGSGVIIDPDGFALSSYHVVANASTLKATVYTAGGAVEYPVKIVKADPATDLVLLRIQGNGQLPFAVLGDSGAARTGDFVIAMGSPFGFEQTITSGIISSRNRTLSVGNMVYENLIQTDCPINKGSSGGPLVSARGEVIGINTAIYSPTGTFSGIGFSVPINSAANLVGGVIDFQNMPANVGAGQLAAWTRGGRQVGNAYRLPGGALIVAPHPFRGNCEDCHPQLLDPAGIGPNGMAPMSVAGGTKGATTDAGLGVTLVDVDDVIARQFNMVHPEGVLVNSVLPGTPAEAAGLERGDIIIRVNGRRVTNSVGFKELIAAKPAGATYSLAVLRKGARTEIEVKTGVVRQTKPKAQQANVVKEFEWLGAEVTPILPALVPYVNDGVYIADVEGPLALAGVKRGDIVKGINNTPVTDMASFIKLSKTADIKKGFFLDIIRSGKPVYITVKG
ncbi:MAG: trypsin-like peptidase domain-containing protein [Nitrospirota bacterium]|nr:trypsin-like peptidase domain-containing protein [Nitrospirota bacterium]